MYLYIFSRVKVVLLNSAYSALISSSNTLITFSHSLDAVVLNVSASPISISEPNLKSPLLSNPIVVSQS